MYIISKNKDYYDGVVGSVGLDKTLVYEREFVEIEDYLEFPNEFRNNQPWKRNKNNHFLNLNSFSIRKESKYRASDSFIIGFCGKLYLGWKFHWEEKELQEYGGWYDMMKTDIIYGYENAKEHLNEISWKSNLADDVKYVLDYDPMNLFREFKTPVFLYDSYYNRTSIGNYWHHNKPRFIINPCLKEWEFYKVVDAFTAFQEISMFIGGVLGIGEKEIIEVEDKYKITQHGFDYKWSFRREPSKNK
jgi:hypothetical protein